MGGALHVPQLTHCHKRGSPCTEPRVETRHCDHVCHVTKCPPAHSLHHLSPKAVALRFTRAPRSMRLMLTGMVEGLRGFELANQSHTKQRAV
jgi:hypothetical protein